MAKTNRRSRRRPGHQKLLRKSFLPRIEELERRDLLAIIDSDISIDEPDAVERGEPATMTLTLDSSFGTDWGLLVEGTDESASEYTITYDPAPLYVNSTSDPDIRSLTFAQSVLEITFTITATDDGVDNEPPVEKFELTFYGSAGSQETVFHTDNVFNVIDTMPSQSTSADAMVGDKGCDCPCNCSRQPNQADGADGGTQTKLDYSLITELAAFGPQHSSDEFLPVVAAVDATFIQGITPDTIQVSVTFNGDTTDPIYYDTTGVDPGELFRLAQQLDTTGLSAGRYPWTMEITEDYSSGPNFTYDVQGFVLVKGPSNSLISRGWSIPGIDRLIVDTGSAIWATGNGDMYWFEEDGGTYTRPDGEGGFSTLVANIDTTYTLTNRFGDESIFDADGLLTEQTDRFGNTITYTYTDGDGDTDADDISEIELHDGRTLTYTYADNRIVGITDFDGREVTLSYDDNDQLEVIAYPDPDGEGELEPLLVAFTYVSGTSLIEDILEGAALYEGEVIGAAQTTSFTYDFANTLETRTNQDSTVENFVDVISIPLIDPLLGLGVISDPAPLTKVEDILASIEDEEGYFSYYALNSLGLPVRKIDALGNETIYERDADGRVTLQVDPDPNDEDLEPAPETHFSYDDYGNLETITFPDSTSRTWIYDLTWHVPEQYTDEFGLVTLYEINSGTGRVDSIRQIVGENDETSSEEDDIVTEFTYNAAPSTSSDPPGGLVDSITDPLGNVTTYVRNSRGNPTSITYADGTADEATEKFHYGAFGLVDYHDDELNRRTYFSYDLLGRLVEVTLPSPGGGATTPVFQYEYNKLNYLIAEIDPLERRTEYTYDSRGRQLTQARVNGGGTLASTSTKYDDRGYVAKITDPLSRATEFTFDELGRLTETSLAAVKDFTTDTNEIQIIEFDSGTEGTFKLNGNSKSTTVDLSNPANLQAALDTLWGPRNTVVTYTSTEATVKFRGDYTGTNVDEMTISDISGTKGATPYVTTDVGGVAADQVNPMTSTVYDALGRVTSEKDALGNITEYEWSDYGNKLKITLPDLDGPGGDSSIELFWEFDKANNRKIETDGNGGETVYQYNQLGQLTSITWPDPDQGGSLAAPMTSYQYDLAGNLRFETNPLGVTTEYEYDHRHRQIKITSADPDGAGGRPELVTEFEFDDANQLIKVTAPGDRETVYAYDGVGRLTSVTAPDPDGVGGVSASVTKYAYDAAGQMISSADPLNNTTTYAYDELGNQVLVLQADPDGNGVADIPAVFRTFDKGGQLTSESQGVANKEIQRLTFGNPVNTLAGTFTLSFDAQTTGTLSPGDSAGTVQSALEGLSGIGEGNILVSQTVDGYIFIFRGAFSNENVLDITVDGSSLTTTQGLGASASVTQSGTADTNEVQVVDFGGATTRTFDLYADFTPATVYSLDSYGLQSALDSLWGSGNTSVYFTGSVYEVTFQGSLAGQNVTDMYVSSNSTDGSPSASTSTTGTAGGPEIIQVSTSGGATGGYWDLLLNSSNVGPFSWDASYTDIQSAFSGAVTVDGSYPSWTLTTTTNGSLGSWSAQNNSLTTTAGVSVTQVQSGEWVTGATTSYTYDNLGQVASETRHGGVSRFEYDLSGNLTKVIDRLKSETSYEYDFLNRRTLSRDPLGGETAFDYDSVGNLLSLTDPVGNTTSWVYDGLNRVTQETNDLSRQRHFAYDAAGNLVWKKDRLNRETTFEYDQLNRPVAEEWWNGTLPSISVGTSTDGSRADEVQNLILSSGSTMISGTFTLTYDGQTTSAIPFDASAATVEAALEALSNIGDGDVQVEKPYDTGTYSQWDVTFVAALAGTDVEQITIDGSGVSDGTSAPSESNYTAVGGYSTNEVQTVDLYDATGGTFTLSFGGVSSDPVDWDATDSEVETALEGLVGSGNVSVSGSAGGPYTITFIGDYAAQDIAPLQYQTNHLTNANLLTPIEYYYTTYGELEQVLQSNVFEYSYHYDNMSRVSDFGGSIGGMSIEFQFFNEYNAASRRTQLHATLDGTNDFKNTYSYDNLLRLTTLVQQTASGGNTVAPKRIELAYNDYGQYERIDRYAATTNTEHVAYSQFTYDAYQRLSQIAHVGIGDFNISHSYTYDVGDRILSKSSAATGFTSNATTYSHDDTNQLIGANHSALTDEEYEYDANGNRTMTGYTTGDNNQLTSDGTYNYTYDDEGNRLTRTRISDGYVTRYEWDHRNRLTKVTEEDNASTVLQTTESRYDAFNQWIRRTFDSDGPGGTAVVDTFFIYESGQAVLEFDGPDDSDLTHRYLWGEMVDQFFADEFVSSLGSAGSVLWGLGDNLGTPRDLIIYNNMTDVSTIANHREFDSYGKLIGQSNATYASTIGFTARMWDVTTSLQGNVYRWYDPAVGRWLSDDPIGFMAGDVNLGRYVSNSSTSKRDPLGLEEVGDTSDPAFDDFVLAVFEKMESGALQIEGIEGDALVVFLTHLQHAFQAQAAYEEASYQWALVESIFSIDRLWTHYECVIQRRNAYRNTGADYRNALYFLGKAIPKGARISGEWSNAGERTGQVARDAADVLRIVALAGGSVGGLQSTGDEQFLLMGAGLVQGLVRAGFRRSAGLIGSRLTAASEARLASIAAKGNCFPKGTIVSTEHGPKPIQEVRTADRVWAFDIVSGQWKLCHVVRTFRHEYDGGLVSVTVSGEVIESTTHHPWWVVRGIELEARPKPEHVPENPAPYHGEGRWVDALDLRVGDVLLLQSGEKPMITSVVFRQTREPVYNFHVEHLQCYAVGKAQVLVHNNSYLINNKSIAGKSASRIRSDIPKCWKELPADKGRGWKLVDEKGVERIRYMYPDKNGRFYHERTGYFRRINEKGEFLDIHGTPVPATDPLFNARTHIVPEN